MPQFGRNRCSAPMFILIVQICFFHRRAMGGRQVDNARAVIHFQNASSKRMFLNTGMINGRAAISD